MATFADELRRLAPQTTCKEPDILDVEGGPACCHGTLGCWEETSEVLKAIDGSDGPLRDGFRALLCNEVHTSMVCFGVEMKKCAHRAIRVIRRKLSAYFTGFARTYTSHCKEEYKSTRTVENPGSTTHTNNLRQTSTNSIPIATLEPNRSYVFSTIENESTLSPSTADDTVIIKVAAGVTASVILGLCIVFLLFWYLRLQRRRRHAANSQTVGRQAAGRQAVRNMQARERSLRRISILNRHKKTDQVFSGTQGSYKGASNPAPQHTPPRQNNRTSNRGRGLKKIKEEDEIWDVSIDVSDQESPISPFVLIM